MIKTPFVPHHSATGLEYRGADGRKIVYTEASHKWILQDTSGGEIDSDTYRYDLAERNNIDLKYKRA